MLTLLFIVLMIGVFGKLLAFGLRATWGIAKLILTIVFLPLKDLDYHRTINFHHDVQQIP